MDASPSPAVEPELGDRDFALLSLLEYLKTIEYAFVTPTPATQARVIGRQIHPSAARVEDVLGWSLPFASGEVEPEVERYLEAANALVDQGGLLKSTLRVSRLHSQLFLHSAYPTEAQNAVFFGPDSYRFADLLTAELTCSQHPARPLVVDIGAGAGVGAITVGRLIPDARLVMTDINPEALRLARVNARSAGVHAEMRLVQDADSAGQPIDLVIANPPYLEDDLGRAYRHGGGDHGAEASLAFAAAGAKRLAAGGRMILYTGSAIVAGRDRLRDSLACEVSRLGCSLRYREVDPDVFGEELDRPQYQDVERIAAVAAVITKGS